MPRHGDAMPISPTPEDWDHMSINRVLRLLVEWSARTMALAALALAFRPSDALAAEHAVSLDDGFQSEDTVAGVATEVEVDGADDPPPAHE